MANMERFFSLRLFTGTSKKLIIGILLVFMQLSFYTQNVQSSSLLRFPLWYVMEEAPTLSGAQAGEQSVFSTATQGIRELAPFFIEGLVYGWEFSYTPSDNVRGVKEYFEMSSIITIPADDYNLRYTDSYVTSSESVIESWVEYDLSQRMVYERQRWHSASFPTIGGSGAASVFDGVDSVKIACEMAAKSAIREYARNIVKNKPKEIIGKILLVDFPRYYIDAGKYVADLDFFLNVSKIVEYTIY